MSELFSLKWNDFQTNVSKSLGSFREEKEYCDVSLVSEDVEVMPAHRLILSASSPYFKHILAQNKHSHPLLCLDGVSSTNLSFVLDYIYHGEVQVYQEQIDDFLKIAQKFQLEGLWKGPSDEGSGNITDEIANWKSEDPKVEVIETKPKLGNIKDRKYPKSRETRDSSPNMDDTMASEEEEPSMEATVASEKLKQKMWESVELRADGSAVCTVCGKTATGTYAKSIIKQHLETHQEGVSFNCQQCGKIFRSKHSLRTHVSKYHGKSF